MSTQNRPDNAILPSSGKGAKSNPILDREKDLDPKEANIHKEMPPERFISDFSPAEKLAYCRMLSIPECELRTLILDSRTPLRKSE